jgi:hypothetical protein
MLLSARMLNEVSGVNAFVPVSVFEFTEGDAPTLYFQLVDLSKDKAEHGFNPPGRRYIPASGATLQCVIVNTDEAKKLTRFAAQPFAQDGSIWALTLTTTDFLRGSVDVLLTLTEGVKVTRGAIRSSINAYPQIRGR